MEFMVRYGRAGIELADTERKARNRIRKLLADQSWRRGFQCNTDIGLFEMDENGTPTIIDAIDVPDDRRLANATNRINARALTARRGVMADERIISVEDHGMFRGRRTWTVRMDGPTGLAQVSVLDATTETRAIADALETYRGRRVVSDEDRAAMQRANAALGRALGGDRRKGPR